MRANALDDVLGILHGKTFGKIDQWDGVVFQAVGFTASDAGKVYVVEVMVVVRTPAHAILLVASAIIDFVQHLVFHKQSQGTEDAAAVHVWQQLFQVVERERLLLSGTLLPNQYAYRRGFHAMFLQVFLYAFHLLCLLQVSHVQRSVVALVYGLGDVGRT